MARHHSLGSTGGLILLWAFWFWSAAEPRPMEKGWVAMPTREACEKAKEQIGRLAVTYSVAAGVSSCRPMTPDELRRQRHEPPGDVYPLNYGH
jgi:hypothetical protein